MTCQELIVQGESQNRELLERGKAAAAKLDDQEWNQAPPKGWSPAQIFEHLLLTNQAYVDLIAEKLKTAPKGGDTPIRHTWFGKIILKSAGPEGNGPVPKPFIPHAGPYTRDVLDRWIAQQQAIIDLHEKAKGVDLTAVRYPVPIMKIFRLSMCDSFAIFASHTERHIRQIEERVKGRAAATMASG